MKFSSRVWRWFMTISRRVIPAFILVISISWQSALAAPILMPAGSTVWMKFESNQAPIEDGNDVAGSNLPGVAPPNGIPLITVIDGNGNSATGYAEILPERIRTFTTGRSQFMHSSFQDTYTVGGDAAGPFDITVQLHVSGTMRTVHSGSFDVLLAGNVQAKIGTFNPDPALTNESFRVTAFNATASADTGAFNLTELGSIPVDITASFAKTGVNVGDVFDIAYQVRSAASMGEIDLLNTGSISFDLPEGVFLTSALAASLVPEPSGLALLATAGFGLAAIGLLRRRWLAKAR